MTALYADTNEERSPSTELSSGATVSVCVPIVFGLFGSSVNVTPGIAPEIVLVGLVTSWPSTGSCASCASCVWFQKLLPEVIVDAPTGGPGSVLVLDVTSRSESAVGLDWFTLTLIVFAAPDAVDCRLSDGPFAPWMMLAVTPGLSDAELIALAMSCRLSSDESTLT